ncbi:MAG: DUF4974 domain-containing protein [Odoribacteraceae bacterium]|nr:DUF4974 domain-containing protein [Odoribacteraceae bacterium]
MEHIILAYLAGECTEEERAQLEAWVLEGEHRGEFRGVTGAYHLARTALLWDRINATRAERLLRERLARGRRRRFMARYSAAAVFLLAGAALWWYAGGDGDDRTTGDAMLLVDKAIPTLTLPDGQVIEIDSLLEERQLPGDLSVTWDEAAAIEYERGTLAGEEEVRHHVLTVPKGCEFKIVLADGSRVWLNAGSVLTYPARFTAASREVSLSGEAYFEVAPAAGAPFRVTTRGMELTVLGTSFDIRAYPDEPELFTALISGKTLQRFDGCEEEVVLRPGEGVAYDVQGRSTRVVKADIEEVLSWKEGRIIARHRSLEEIFRLLNKWYDFEVTYADPTLKDIRFYLNMKRYDNVQEVLDNLCSTGGISFSRMGNTIHVSREG